MVENKIHMFNYNGKPFRVHVEGGEAKFVLEDVVNCLGMDEMEAQKLISELNPADLGCVCFETDTEEDTIYIHSDRYRSIRYYFDHVDRYYAVDDIAKVAKIDDVESAMNFAYLNNKPSIFVLKSIYKNRIPVNELETVNLEGALAMTMYDMDHNPAGAAARLKDLANFLKPLEQEALS